MKRIRLLVVLLTSTAVGCIEQFTPDIPQSNGELVVEGHITDQTEEYLIRLSRSRRLDEKNNIAETGATVKIIEDGSMTHLFQEMEGGRYVSKAGNFVGSIGSEYILDIVTADGEHYQSHPEVMLKTPDIDSVYFERERRFTDIEDLVVDGIKILVDSHDPENATRYYKWDWVETWEYKATYPNAYSWVPGDMIFDPGHPIVNPFPNIFCYNTDSSRQILVNSTNNLENDVVSRFEVKYVNTLGRELTSLYSLLVKQHAISENTYKYWRELRGLSESQGTLFDKQPYALQGNIGNVQNADETVLGYFEVISVKEERILITREKLRDLYFPSNTCFHEKIDSVNYWNVQDLLDQGYLIYGAGGFMVEFVDMVPRDCADCTYHGSLEKPDYIP